MVCHNKIESEYEALKPYVCGSKLCEYQYYQLSMGPSLEVRTSLQYIPDLDAHIARSTKSARTVLPLTSSSQ